MVSEQMQRGNYYLSPIIIALLANFVETEKQKKLGYLQRGAQPVMHRCCERFQCERFQRFCACVCPHTLHLALWILNATYCPMLRAFSV
jgi:hypothetical protein